MRTITGSVSREALDALSEFEDTFGPMAGIQARRAVAVTRHNLQPLRDTLSSKPSRFEALEAASRVGSELAAAVRTLLPLCFENAAPDPQRIQAVVGRLTGLDDLLNRVAEAAQDPPPPPRLVTPANVDIALSGPTRTTTHSPGAPVHQSGASVSKAGLTQPMVSPAFGSSPPSSSAEVGWSEALHEGRTVTPPKPVLELLPGFASDDAPAQVTLSFGAFDAFDLPDPQIRQGLSRRPRSRAGVTLPFGVDALQIATEEGEETRRSTTRSFTIDTGIDRPSLLQLLEAAYIELETVVGTADPALCAHLDSLEAHRVSGQPVSSTELSVLLTDFTRIVCSPAGASVRNRQIVELALDSALGALSAMARQRLA